MRNPAADLPVDDIILYHNPDIDLLATVPTQVERMIEDGVVRYQTLLGDAPLNPEEELIRGETEQMILASLPKRLRATGAQILNVIFSLDSETMSPLAIFAKLAERNVDIAEAQKVFLHLRRNAQVKSYLLGGE